MSNVLLVLRRSGKMTKPVQRKKKDGTPYVAKGEWGKMELWVGNRKKETFDTIERRGGYVFLPPNNYVVKKYNFAKLGGRIHFRKYLGHVPAYNSLDPGLLVDDGGTPDDYSDDLYKQFESKKLNNILIHPSFYPWHLAGCIAPGRRVKDYKIWDSYMAVAHIFEAMGTSLKARLRVENGITDDV